jgi:flagellar motor protein MotB
MPGLGRTLSLAVALGLGLALGACSTMSDVGEATTDGVTKVANAMNPFNWFDDSDEDQGDSAGRADQQRAAAATAPKSGPKSAPRRALAQRDVTEDEARYPKLSDMPDRPREATSKKADQARQELREGLVADTQNAQYTDNELRAQTDALAGTSQGVSGRADSARSNERLSGEPPAAPAPTMPVTAAPVASQPPVPQPAPPQPAVSPPAAPQQQVAAATPRVAPPAAARPPAPPPTGYGARQAAAASAAPMARAAPTPAAPQRRVARAAPQAEPAPAPAAPRTVLKTVQVATIYFNSGSARLSRNDRQIVGQVAAAARRTGGMLRIIGHSSMANAGKNAEHAAMVNYKMSLERANAVASELLRQGIPGNQMQVMAEGAQNPIYAESSATGIAGNRRTEIYLDFYETR